MEVSKGNAVEVAEFLANQTSAPAPEEAPAAERVEAISDILENIVNVGTGDTQVSRHLTLNLPGTQVYHYRHSTKSDSKSENTQRFSQQKFSRAALYITGLYSVSKQGIQKHNLVKAYQ